MVQVVQLLPQLVQRCLDVTVVLKLVALEVADRADRLGELDGRDFAVQPHAQPEKLPALDVELPLLGRLQPGGLLRERPVERPRVLELDPPGVEQPADLGQEEEAQELLVVQGVPLAEVAVAVLEDQPRVLAVPPLHLQLRALGLVERVQEDLLHVDARHDVHHQHQVDEVEYDEDLRERLPGPDGPEGGPGERPDLAPAHALVQREHGPEDGTEVGDVKLQDLPLHLAPGLRDVGADGLAEEDPEDQEVDEHEEAGPDEDADAGGEALEHHLRVARHPDHPVYAEDLLQPEHADRLQGHGVEQVAVRGEERDDVDGAAHHQEEVEEV
mmetsp:Transcript_57051/g.161051  ORF Transcript_57051/g.161051 Transcript_57051/m.161051 type:complete len:328 (-) Transcript_57051:112-1095(-)